MLVIDLKSDNPLNKFAPYQHMANVIIELTNKNGECFPEDLLEHGFSKEETRDLWHMANAMASIELKLEKNLILSNRNKREGQYIKREMRSYPARLKILLRNYSNFSASEDIISRGLRVFGTK